MKKRDRGFFDGLGSGLRQTVDKLKMRKKPVSPEYRRYRRRLFLRKFLLYFVLLISFFIILTKNITIYSENYRDRLKPQIYRAVIQVARIIPQLEESETALRDVCDQMNNSWERMAADGLLDETDYDIPDTRSKLEQFIGETLSWMDRVTRLKVGRDGCVVVVDKDTMSVIAHPDQTALGIRLIPDEPLTKDNVLSIRSVSTEINADDLGTKFNLFELHNPKDEDYWDIFDIDDYLYRSIYGCIIEYEDYYIICGITFYERLSFLSTAFFITVILVLYSHTHSLPSL